MVTGLGVVSPVGIGNDTAWENLVAGRSGSARSPSPTCRTRRSSRRRGPDFDPTVEMDPKDVRRHDRATQMAVAATAEALRDGGLINGNSQILEEADPDRRHGLRLRLRRVSILLENAKKYWDVGPNRVSPWTIPTCWSTARRGWSPSSSVSAAEHRGRERVRDRQPRHR